MVEFSKEVCAKYKAFDYDGVIKNYEWIKNTTAVLFTGVVDPTVRIAFKMGDISCSCDSIYEFKEHAYGQNIEVCSYVLSLYRRDNDEKKWLARIIFSCLRENEITIDCNDKQTLITICTALENSLSAPEEKQPILLQQTVNHIDQSTNISIGANNTIQDSNIGVGNQLNKEEHSEKSSFWKPIWQTIVANGIWLLLGLEVVALLTYFGFNTDWTSIF